MLASSAMATETDTQLHGGRLIARSLAAAGVTKLFTLSGGHLFSIYDGCQAEGIEIVDVRHEQSAAFAAEGWAKVTRSLGVCALTAGPGRHERDQRDRVGAREPFAGTGARRPRARVSLGAGIAAGDRSHPVRRAAGQARRDRRQRRRDPRVARAGDARLADARTRARRSSTSRSTTCSGRPPAPERSRPLPQPWRGARRRAASSSSRAAALLREAEQPVIMAGSGLYWGRGETAAAGAGRAAARAGVPQRARPRMPGGRPRAVLLARAERRPRRRRRRAGDRRAARLPARVRRRVRPRRAS